MNGEWQPIETAPNDGTRILCAWLCGGRYDVAAAKWAINDSESGWFDNTGGTWFDDEGRECNPPTHWMPLPDPPAEDSPRG